MTNELATKEQSLASKREAWGKLGVSIYEKDLEFQVRAQSIIKEIITPSKIEDVAEAEKRLKEVKRKKKELQNDRLSVTNPVKNRLDELANAENSIDEFTDKAENAIKELKRNYETEQLQKTKKAEQIKKCKESLTILKNNSFEWFRKCNIEKCSKAYEYALGDGKITIETVNKFKETCINRRKPEEFSIITPKNTYDLISQEEYNEICFDILGFDPSEFIKEYSELLNVKFSDYAVALNNKAESLRIAKEEDEKKQAEIAQKAQMANVAAKLESVAVEPTVQQVIKPLKQSYAIDMPENIESVAILWTAFIANLTICLPKLNVTKWFSLTPTQVAGALAKVKNDDNNFNPTGIVFKVVDKL